MFLRNGRELSLLCTNNYPSRLCVGRGEVFSMHCFVKNVNILKLHSLYITPSSINQTTRVPAQISFERLCLPSVVMNINETV